MARIVLTSLGSYGDVNPYIGLGLALRARGHDPVLATSALYRDYVEREGLGFRAIRPHVDPNDGDLVARIMDARRGTEFLLRRILLPSLRESYADLTDAVQGADLLVTHPITFAGPIVAQERRLPWLSTVLAPMSFFSPHDLPVFPPAPWLKRLERLGPWTGRLLVALARSATRRWPEPVHQLRRERGLPPGGDPIFEGQHAPDGVLALFSRVLAHPQPDWPPRVRITGHIFYNGPPHEHLPDELERFLASGDPPIVFTLGTSAVRAAGAFYQESLDAVQRLGRRAVLLVGHDARNRPGGPIPDSVRAAEFAPHDLIFPRAAAIVHQGGIGTLAQALRAGKPMLVVPFAHDQPDNAWRVARLGVARTISIKRYRAGRVAAALRELLKDSAYARRAEEVAQVVRGEDGAAAACDAIEARLTATGA